jgi:hypothetical protein
LRFSREPSEGRIFIFTPPPARIFEYLTALV